MSNVDGLDVVWAFRPDDPSKQGKTERLAPDVAKLKVAEGLATWPKPKPAPEPELEEAPAKSAGKPAGKSS